MEEPEQSVNPVETEVSADPVLAKELVKILSEVEANGEEVVTPPTLPSLENGPAGFGGTQESTPCTSLVAIKEIPQSQEQSMREITVREMTVREVPVSRELAVSRELRSPFPGLRVFGHRPETAYHGLEVGPDTCQRWMPRMGDAPSEEASTGMRTGMTGLTGLASQGRCDVRAAFADTDQDYRPQHPARFRAITAEDANDPRGLSKASASKPPPMPELLRNLWAQRANEPEPLNGLRRHTIGEWRHGEMYFEETGRVCRFLVPPASDLEAADVAQVLLDAGFGLPKPDAFFSVQSSPGNYWDMDHEISHLRRCGVRWPADMDEARDLYRRDMELLMLGVCTAAAESGAWLVGSGRRSGGGDTGALFEAGLRQYMRVHPDRMGDLPFLGLGGPCGPDVFEHAGVRLGPGLCPWSTLINPLTGELIDLRRSAVPLWEPVTEQVRYPDVGAFWTHRVAVEGRDMDETLGCLCLNPTLSHLVLCTDLVKSKVHDLLEHLLPSVHVVSSGRNRASLEHAVDRATRGAQVLVLQNSGIWANLLAKAALERQGFRRRAAGVAVSSGKGGGVAGSSSPRPFVLPDQVEASKFLVFDILTDNEERVVEKITNTLTTLAGEDTRELGFASSERQRLQYAWDLYLLYTMNARRMLCWSRVAHYTCTVISLLTTTCAVLLTASNLPDSAASTLGEVGMVPYSQVRFSKTQSIFLALACSLMPLLSAFLLSVNSRFAPRTKYATFIAAAAKVRSAIYKYRGRVGEYIPGSRNSLIRNLASELSRRQGGHMVPNGRATAAESTAMPSARGRPQATPTPELREAGRGTQFSEAARETAPAGWGLIGGGPGPVSVASRGTTSTIAGPNPCTAARYNPGKERGALRLRAHSNDRVIAKPSERFAEVLGAIHTELMAAVAKSGFMAEPTSKDWERLERSLGHRPSNGQSSARCSRASKWCCCCCYRSRRPINKVVPDPKVFTMTSAGLTRQPESHAEFSEEVALDNAFCLITADDYLHFRVQPLIAGLKVRAPFLARTWAFTQMVSFLGTAVAGALGMLSMREFIPIVVAAVSAVDSVAQFEQLQVRMVATNGALAQLQGLLLWWNALPMVERRKSRTKDYLISATEDVAGSEAAVFGCSARIQVSPRLFTDDSEEEERDVNSEKRGWRGRSDDRSWT